jgi:hypothetical protein
VIFFARPKQAGNSFTDSESADEDVNMTRITFSQTIAGALFSLCLAAVPAGAALDHTYVSGTGTDTGTCVSAAVPCRTFAYALTQTAISGEIIVMNAANYGPVTITAPVSIVADGAGPAGIILATGNAITINATQGVVFNLRGLTLDGEGTASSGIVVTSGGSLTIADCFIRNFQNNGILINATSMNVSVLNTVMNNNGTGLTIVGSGLTNTYLTVRNSVANYNITGFSVTGTTVKFADSMATGNARAGILIGSVTGDVSRSQVLSYGDNEIDNNGTDVSGGSLTPLAKR